MSPYWFSVSIICPVMWGPCAFCVTVSYSLYVCSDLLYVFRCSCVGCMGLPRWHTGKESACQCGRHRRLGFDPWVRKMLWSWKWQPTPIFLPGKFHGQESLEGYNPWAHKESDMTEWLSTHTHTRVGYIYVYSCHIFFINRSLD